MWCAPQHVTILLRTCLWPHFFFHFVLSADTTIYHLFISSVNRTFGIAMTIFRAMKFICNWSERVLYGCFGICFVWSVRYKYMDYRGDGRFSIHQCELQYAGIPWSEIADFYALLISPTLIYQLPQSLHDHNIYIATNSVCVPILIYMYILFAI